MATFTKFEEFARNLGQGVHNFGSHTLKIALTNSAPNADTYDTLSDITQISAGNGYSSGGATVGSVTWAETSSGSGVWALGGADVVFTASGGNIGPFRYAVLYNDTPTSPADPLIGYLDYGESVTIEDGNTFTVDVDADGFLQIS